MKSMEERAKRMCDRKMDRVYYYSIRGHSHSVPLLRGLLAQHTSLASISTS